MRRYIAQLYDKPDHHKKRLALLSSATITLFILGIWSIANFGVSARTVANNQVTIELAREETSEVGPFESLRMNIAASIEALRQTMGNLREGIGDVNFEAEYEEMRNGAIEIYGE